MQHRGSRFSSRPQRSFGGRPRFANKQSKKRASFNPSMFVKKAEEQPAQVEYVPNHQFTDFGFVEQLEKNIIARGYTAPTSIQDQIIPILISGRDVVGQANTGTGKTAAFLLPLIHKVFSDRSQKVLIVAPTRELAVQIEQEFKLFAQNMKLYSVLCIGGTNIRTQMYRLKLNPQFVIGTPGRLKDLEQQRALSFAGFNNIVLDEVDQMLDMGFIHDVRYIASRLPQQRQSLFFSATMPDNAQSIMRELLRNPARVSVQTRESSANIDQDVIRTNGQPKIDLLNTLLRQDGFDKVLVFLRTKHGADKLHRNLDQLGHTVVSIHGNKSQPQRQRAIEQFKKNRVKILLATDVASRGLDIDNVTHVINFDLPETYEDYIHRIGRTGRADKKGTALTFID